MEVEISEEELARDWRVRAKFKRNYGEYWDYYCAFGKTCPRKVKKKILINDVFIISTNGLDHENHQSFEFGLSDEQKTLVLECLESGVTALSNIMMTFRAKKPNWYLGFVDKCIPTTNNALESTNRYIKDMFTKRKKRLIGTYMHT
jgi:hypothetical protein